MKRSIRWCLLPLAAAFLYTLAPVASAQTEPGAQDTSTLTAAPAIAVTLAGDTVFVVRARIGSFSPEERAAAISNRLQALSRDPLRGSDQLQVADSEATTDIMAGDRVIVTLTDADARAAGVTRLELAQTTAAAMQRALSEEVRATSLTMLLRGAAFALLATAVLVAVLLLFRRFFPRMYRLVRLWKGTRIRSLRFQKLEIVSADRIAAGIVGALKLLRVVLTLVLLYFYLPLVFSFFPWTRPLATELTGYVTRPISSMAAAILGYLPNVFFIIIIVIGTYYFLRLLRLVFDAIASGTITLPNFYPDWAVPTYKIVRFLVLAFGLIMIWPYLPKNDSPAFKGVAAFLGLLLSLGSASAIANAIGGVVMIYMRPFQLGDRVRIADTVGDVVEKNLLVTRIRTIKNVDITVPNSMVLNSHIVNYSAVAAELGVIMHTTITIGYDAPWRQVHEVMLSAARATTGILAEPAPFILQTSLDDFYVSYQLNAYTNEANRMAAIYSGLHQNLQDKFNEAGIEIMSPHYGALRDGNQTTIPADHLPAGYEPPSFRLQRVGASEANGNT